MEWKPISSAPFDRDLELAVIDQFRLRLGKQHLDHGPLCRIGFRGE